MTWYSGPRTQTHRCFAGKHGRTITQAWQKSLHAKCAEDVIKSALPEGNNDLKQGNMQEWNAETRKHPSDHRKKGSTATTLSASTPLVMIQYCERSKHLQPYLTTEPTEISLIWLRKVYSTFFKESELPKVKVEPGEEDEPVNETAVEEELANARPLHDRQMFARFGWILPQLRWKFEVTWPSKAQIPIYVQKDFDLFSR
jgi:hypothetical protein